MRKLKTKILSSILAVAMFVNMVMPTVWAASPIGENFYFVEKDAPAKSMQTVAKTAQLSSHISVGFHVPSDYVADSVESLSIELYKDTTKIAVNTANWADITKDFTVAGNNLASPFALVTADKYWTQTMPYIPTTTNAPTKAKLIVDFTVASGLTDVAVESTDGLTQTAISWADFVTSQDAERKPAPVVNKDILKADIAAATKLLGSVVETIADDGSDVATTKTWATSANRATYKNVITSAQSVDTNATATQAEVDAAVAVLKAATTTFHGDGGSNKGQCLSGTQAVKAETPTVDGSNKDAPAVSIEGGTGAGANSDTAVTIPTSLGTTIAGGSGASATVGVTLPDPATKGTISSITVPATVFSTASKEVILVVKDSNGNTIATWTVPVGTSFTEANLDILAETEVALKDAKEKDTPINLQGLDPAATRLVAFGHNKNIPANVTVKVGVTLADGLVYIYHVNDDRQITNIDNPRTSNVSSNSVTFAPGETTGHIFSKVKLDPAKPPVINPPIYDTYNPYPYAYYGFMRTGQEIFTETFEQRLQNGHKGQTIIIEMPKDSELTPDQLKAAAIKGVLLELRQSGKDTIIIDPSKMKFSSEKYSFDDLVFLFTDVADGDAVVIAPPAIAPTPEPTPIPEPTKSPQTGDNWFSNLFIDLFA